MMIILYNDILEQFKIKPIIFREYINSLPQKAILIRHDIDDQLSKSINMAIWEANKGIQSTYFVLPNATYFEYSKKFIDTLKIIQDCGHEIGLHNNALLDYLYHDINYSESIERPLKFLRDNYIYITGTSAHKYHNCQMWSEFNYNNCETTEEVEYYCGGRFPKVSLKKYDLQYEAYFIDYTFYITDSAKKITGMILSNMKLKPSEHTIIYSKNNQLLNIIINFNKSDNGIMQILFHPQHWENNINQWFLKERFKKA